MTEVKYSKPSALMALTTTALALPGLSKAAVPPEHSTLSYRYSKYQEEDLEAEFIANSDEDVERYEIDVHQLHLNHLFKEKFALTAEVTFEDLTGASPFNTSPDANNRPLVNILTGPTIDEQRLEARGGVRYYLDDGTIGGNLGFSTENDYEAIFGGVDGELELNNKLTTLAGGFSFSFDDIDAVAEEGESFPIVPVQDEKRSISLFQGVSHVINRYSIFQVGYSLTLLNGFLSDPYKVNDERPNKRIQWTFTTGYRYFFAKANGALHLDYRFYSDDWEVTSNTLDVSWFQNFEGGWQVIPSLRYYSQSEAEFYEPFFDPIPGVAQSSDYRLSPFGAITLGLRVVKKYNDWSFVGGIEVYESDGDLALGDVAVENPGIIDYTRITIGVDRRF